MNKARVNFYLDLIGFFAMVVIFFTGFLMWGWKRPQAATSVPGKAEVVQVQKVDTPEKNLAGETRVETQKSAGDGGKDMASRTFLGMGKGGWKQIHCWSGVAILLPMLILHLLMHLEWIKVMLGFCKREV